MGQMLKCAECPALASASLPMEGLKLLPQMLLNTQISTNRIVKKFPQIGQALVQEDLLAKQHVGNMCLTMEER